MAEPLTKLEVQAITDWIHRQKDKLIEQMTTKSELFNLKYPTKDSQTTDLAIQDKLDIVKFDSRRSTYIDILQILETRELPS
jgi:hypothetical protein